MYEIPLFPLHTVLFPGMILPLHIFEERYKIMMHHCLTRNHPFGVVLIREGSEIGGGAKVFDVGTTAHITQVDKLSDGRMNIATLGIHRFKIHRLYEDKEPYLVGLVEAYPFDESDAQTIQHEAQRLAPILMKYLDTLAQISQSEVGLDKIPDDATTLALLTAIVMRIPTEEKQALLSVGSLAALLQQEYAMLNQEARVLDLMTKTAPSWRDEPMPFSPN